MGFDDDSCDHITWEVFRSKLDDPEMKEYFRAINVDPSEAQGLFWLLDADGTCGLDCEELVHGLLRLRGSAKSLDLALLTFETERMSKRFREHAVSMEENFSEVREHLSTLKEHGGRMNRHCLNELRESMEEQEERSPRTHSKRGSQRVSMSSKASEISE